MQKSKNDVKNMSKISRLIPEFLYGSSQMIFLERKFAVKAELPNA